MQQRWPSHGPYSHERTVEAAEAITLLVRYLTDVTGRRDAVPYPITVHRMLAEIATATCELEQLLHRVLERLASTDANAFDDRGDRPAGNTIDEVEAELAGARVTVRVLAEQLDRAARYASHLKVEERRPTSNACLAPPE